MRQCAGTVKRLSLELGGNAPFIVFDDADLDGAVAGAIQLKYRNTGQTCVCANRILVQAGSTTPSLRTPRRPRLGALRVGAGRTPASPRGRSSTPSAWPRSRPRSPTPWPGAPGCSPAGDGTPSAGPSSAHRPGRTSPGDARRPRGDLRPGRPARSRFDTEAEAIALANDTESGLAAYFYSRDLGRVWRVAEALEYGMVGVNTGVISTEVAPFGGVKQSGSGARGRATASRSTSRSSTSASGACERRLNSQG